ncbi:MAG: hypothetical protein GSR81_01430 [Desulfurococcales archaeon]|nr:hypothetical protein [Desulfurococcales archaeon]
MAKMGTGRQAGVGVGKVGVRVEVSGEVLWRLLSKEEGEEIFGLLKGWKVDPQRLKDELREG